MSIWLIAAIALALAVAPCALVLFRSEVSGAFVALQMIGVIMVVILLVLAQALHRPSFFDLSLALALLSIPSGYMFAHCLERWLR